MKTKSITVSLLTLVSALTVVHAGGLMIDDFEHSSDSFGAIRHKRFGYVTLSDEAEGILTGTRAGYLLASGGAGPGVGWDGHCLVYEGSAETNKKDRENGSALFSISYTRDSGRSIPSSGLSWDGKPLDFSLSGQKRLEILFRECHLGEAESINLYLRMGDADGRSHEIKMVKLPGAEAASFPLAPFIEKGLNIDKLVGIIIRFGESVSPDPGLPSGTDFKIEHIRTVDTDTLPDTDGDGQPDLIEQVTGGDALNPKPQPNQLAQSLETTSTVPTFTYRRLASLPELLTPSIEFSTDLITWKKGAEHLTTVSTSDAGNGFQEIKVRPNTANSPQGFFRISVNQTTTTVVR